MTTLTVALAGPLLVMLCLIVLALVFGGPTQPAPMPSINDPLKSIDYSDMPGVKCFVARDGTQLGFREYSHDTGERKGSVVLIHGSSASSNSMHLMAKEFAQAGYVTYSLDIRGHGQSGVKGQIAYIGQLENDLEDFTKFAKPSGKRTLVGFSSGGGFALRFAGSAGQKLFDNYLLLSPFIHQDAPTSRPGIGGWVSVGLPRIIALTVLNQFGITVFNGLPVTTFALNEEARKLLTPQNSFSLSQNFRPRPDYRSDISAVGQPLEILAGEDDEAFHAEHFAAVFRDAGNAVPVTLIPDIGHIGLILSPISFGAAISAVGRLAARANSDASQTKLFKPAEADS